MGSRALLISATLVLVLSAEHRALALQGGEDPALLPVLVDKRYGSAGRSQLGLQFSTPVVSKFVQSTGGYLTYDYSFSDLIGLELGGGYFVSGETGIMQQVRASTGMEPALSDLYQMVWCANVDLILMPIYGKISFASEVDPSFDLFVLAGAGFAGLRRQVGLDGGTFDTKSAPAFNAGFGFRFYINRLAALRLELRDFFYPEQAPAPLSGMTFNLQFQGGIQLSFGGGD